ncbi:CLUMA_CG011702, isoform A [Clunio marinus]|uniref:CLUMA_CG011702, isoform A n=1 Tax=Clunio marinus TaxID=568069 RepID=A0A1J1IFM0_9DIPT|nr:CLUMA_CG011702, isoform A [Clunio marinus]
MKVTDRCFVSAMNLSQKRVEMFSLLTLNFHARLKNKSFKIGNRQTNTSKPVDQSFRIMQIKTTHHLPKPVFD